ncbi:unnamed protein product [Paramecium primaurelia]|uniref:WD40-repeat-containing domain n=2 Tax=Paramecium primaurelia TaxID=5886 RepID=A0A8S1LII9_PARPR|nr:unnamed protein product [Paramecium primaurelia]
MSNFQKKLPQDYCLKHEHQRIEFFLYQKHEQIIQYYCIFCIEENSQLWNLVQPIQRVADRIEANLMIRNRSILDQLQKQENSIENQHNRIQGIFKKWNKFIQELHEVCLIYKFEDEVKILYNDFYDQQNQELLQRKFFEKIQAEKQSYIEKIQQELEQIKISLIKFKQQSIIQRSLNKNNEKQLYILKGEQEEHKYSCGIEIFKNTIIASSEQEVKVWQILKSDIDNTIKLQLKETLKNHVGRVLCSVHSKKIDWFATTGCDGKIFISKLIDNKWVTKKSSKYHHKSIYTMILNNKEDQLFSGGQEGTVAIWNINLEENTIVFSYELIESQYSIFSLCINPSDTSLILSNINQTLVLWTKNSQTKKYEISDRYSLSNIAYRSCFIKEDQFVIQHSQKDVTRVFNINNNKIIERKDLELKFYDTQLDGDYLFPTIYNQKKQILIQKYGKYVYVIKQLPNEKLQIIQTIDCQDSFNYGNVSDDGNILIIWDYYSKKLKIYSFEIQTYNTLFNETEYLSFQTSQLQSQQQSQFQEILI